MKTQSEDARRIKKVVVTRSARGNAHLASRLKARGFEPVAVDTIEFLPPLDWSSVDASLKRLSEFDWALFTSATGVEFFARRMTWLSLAIPWRGKPAAAAVGEGTSAALRRRGVDVDFVPSVYLTRALAEELPRGRGKSVIILRAEITDSDLAASLERDGMIVCDRVVYRTSPFAGQGGADAAVEGADAIVFASSSAVEAFMSKLEPTEESSAMVKRMPAFCIGPVTAKTAKAHGFEEVITPVAHTTESLLSCLEREAAAREGK